MSERDLKEKAKEVLNTLDVVQRELAEIRMWALALSGKNRQENNKHE